MTACHGREMIMKNKHICRKEGETKKMTLPAWLQCIIFDIWSGEYLGVLIRPVLMR